MLEELFKQYGGVILALMVFALLALVVGIIGGTNGNTLAPFFQNVLTSITNKAAL